MPALRKASAKPFTKVIISKGYGFHTPQDGSVCRIKVIEDETNLLTGLDDERSKEIVVGDVDETVDRIIEDCIRTMKEEEECCVEFSHPYNTNADSVIPVESNEELKVEEMRSSVPDNTMQDSTSDTSVQPMCIPTPEVEAENKKNSEQTGEVSDVDMHAETVDDNIECVPSSVKLASPDRVKIQFQLLSYTREPEIWEMSITEKWRRASYHKQRGLDMYARGAYQFAFRRFGLTLKYVISLEHDVPSGQEEGMDIKGLKLSCYLNVAACQMRHHNFESVVINSSKALALQPNNAKALYRRGAAYLQLQEYEKAKEDLNAAQQLEPKNQAIAKQLQVLKSQVQKLNQYYASAMKKMFS